MKKIAAFAFLVWITGLCQAQSPYDTLIQRGEAQLVAKDSVGALATGQQAIKLDANRWEAYALAGGALMKLNRWDDAISQFSDAMQRAPQDKQAGLSALRKQCFAAESGAAPGPAAPAVAPAGPVAAQPAPTTQAEIVLWESIKSSTNPDDFKTYLQTYPNGAFAPLAQRQLANLNSMVQQQATAQQRLLQSQAEDQAEGVWTDPASGLMWTAKDGGAQNMAALKWDDALGYCNGLRLAGHSDWRLPSIDELSALYDPANSEPMALRKNTFMHINRNIQLYWKDPWSSTPTGHGDKFWFLDFGNDQRLEESKKESLGVLCVRDPNRKTAQ